MTPLAAALLVFSLHTQDQPPRADCREWHECRQMALEAAERGEYERFHDLAWRAIQTGPKNDPALMYLLARAQSLSGRPADALVILQRLADMGVPTDAATNDDFRRVRALPGWPGKSDEVLGPAKADPTGKRKPDSTGISFDATRFATMPFTPAGLAYDSVSRRFIVGDRRARRLAVVDEFSQHVANLASAQSAGFGDIVALEIDSRQGDLWVVSANRPQSPSLDARGTSIDAARDTLHKLQLISGRALASYVPAERFGDVELVDVATTPDTGVLVLDRAGHRIFRLRPKASALELALTLPDNQPASIAPAAEGIVYVAHASGVSRVDLASRAVSEVRPAKGGDLSGITRVRWHKGSLIAVQQTGSGTFRAVRIELDRQSHVAAIHPLDASLSTIAPTAATVSGGVLYYLASTDGSEMTVRKVILK